MSSSYTSPRDHRAGSSAGRTSEAGVTVVEMLVATFILGLGVMGVASLFVTGARSLEVSERQADATDVATSELEIIRALNYENLGIASSSDGYVPTFDGRETVTVDEKNLVEAISSITRAGTDFKVERSVTWAVVGSNKRAYKIIVVTVRWGTPAGERSVSTQTGRYEGTAGG